MTANDDFFAISKQAQSTFKHAILRRYLAVFAGATGSTSAGHRVGFLDGYAGPGEYGGSAGSPRLALDIAEAQASAGVNLECIFVEKDPKIFASLSDLVAASATHAVAWQGDVKDHLAGGLKQFADIPALVFLDPFGAALDNNLTVDTILKRGGDAPTELLLNFSVQAVRRMGSRVWEATGAVGRDATLNSLDTWLGGDWWRPIFEDPALLGEKDRADIAATRVAREYAKRVRASTGCGSFGVAIRRRASHKPLFMLTLFHQRALAAYKYNEAVSMAQQEWREVMWGMDLAEAEKLDETEPRLGISYADEIREVWKADKIQFNLDAISTIKERVTTTLKTQSKVSIQKELSKVFGEAAGLGRETHLRSAWKQLAEEGITDAVPKGPLSKATISRTDLSNPPKFK